MNTAQSELIEELEKLSKRDQKKEKVINNSVKHQHPLNTNSYPDSLDNRNFFKLY